MIIVMNRFNVAQGHETEFEAAFKGRARQIEGMPGFMSLDLLRPVQGVYMTMTRWRSMADFETWTGSDAFKQAHSKRHPGLFAGHPQLEIYEVFESTVGE